MTRLDAFRALAAHLIEQSLAMHICAVCGTDLVSGEWFSDHAHPDECVLVDAMCYLPTSLDGRDE